MNILLIDDEDAIVDELSEYFKRRGHKVSGADGVDEAFQALASRTTFDLVLADMRMPKGTGEDVLRVCMRVLSPCPALILMTGLASEEDIKQAQSYGALAVFRKPLIPSQLGEILRIAGERLASRSPDEAAQAARPLVF